MTTYIEYTMDDGATILFEAESSTGGVVRSARGSGLDVIQTGKKFSDALSSIRGSLKALIDEMDALKVEEAEVKFGLKAIGEAGVFAVGKVGGEMNYEVTLKWKKPEEQPKPKKSK